MARKKISAIGPNYEILIHEEPGEGNVHLTVKVNDEIKEPDFEVLFSLIEEYNMIMSLKEIIEAKYEILDKMELKEIYYPKAGTLACITVIKDFDKTYVDYLKLYFKNKLIYFIGKQNKELQKKSEDSARIDRDHHFRTRRQCLYISI